VCDLKNDILNYLFSKELLTSMDLEGVYNKPKKGYCLVSITSDNSLDNQAEGSLDSHRLSMINRALAKEDEFKDIELVLRSEIGEREQTKIEESLQTPGFEKGNVDLDKDSDISNDSFGDEGPQIEVAGKQSSPLFVEGSESGLVRKRGALVLSKNIDEHNDSFEKLEDQMWIRSHVDVVEA